MISLAGEDADGISIPVPSQTGVVASDEDEFQTPPEGSILTLETE